MTFSKLSSFSLQGYKTFAKETNLLFPARITAIIGPNGSGKSNVADAIRWVLGEQSYSLLRAKKTEDMIYSGSESRARAGMASVSISFDNSGNWLPIDYSEVVLTRRAYRDGSNEYFINKQKVRLKDFHELLGKTGLSDRTYTIIGQGLVDLALSIKPDERRKLFEEAAGIGLYRSRKEEALRRLDTTAHNLERAGDILDEIRPRLRNLEKQAARVGEYRQVEGVLKKNLQAWYGFHYHQAMIEIERLEVDLRKAQAEQLAFQQNLEMERSNSLEVKAKLDAKQTEIKLAQAVLQDLQAQLSSQQQKAVIFEERKQALLLAQEQSNADYGVLEETVSAGLQSMQSAQAEVDKLSKDLEVLKEQHETARLRATEARKRRQLLNRQYNDCQAKLIAAEKDLVVLRARYKELKDRNANAQSLREKNLKSLEDIKLQVSKAGETKEGLAAELELTRQELAAAEALLKQHSEGLRQVKSNVDEVNTRLNKLNLEKNRLSNQLDLLRQGQESLAGFSQGAKSLMKAFRSAHASDNLTDLVSKLEVPREYERAITASLGEAIDVIVAGSEALDADVLAKMNASTSDRVAVIGRQGRPLKEAAIPDLPGLLGPCLSKINYPNEYHGVLNALLGDFLLAQDLSSALALQKSLPDFNFVSLDGEVLLKNGLTILGKTQSSGKVSYSRTVKELEAQIADVVNKANQLFEDEKKLVLQKSKIEAEQRKVESEKQALAIKRDRLQKELNNAELEAQKLLNNCKWLERQLEDNRQLVEENSATLEQISRDDGKTTLVLEELRKELEAVKAEQHNPEWAHADEHFQFLDTERQMLNQALSNAQRTQQNLSGRTEQDKARLAQAELRRVQQKEQMLALQESIALCTNEGQTLVAKAQEQQETVLSGLLNEHHALNEAYQRVSESDLESQKRASIFERELTHLQLEQDHARDKLETMKARMSDDFGLIELEFHAEAEASAVLPFPQLVLEDLPQAEELPEGLEEEIRVQKSQIRRIGAVNFEVEQEYREVKERYDSLTTQTVDLNEAIADIQAIIQELDEVMKKEFLETYHAVSIEFTKMFARLFNGGAARLLLQDESSPIEGGIDIEARLPGKREQGLVLLSGGERSLTAVALIFALLKVSPTPFCVLDEVDAMLDESNVGRFIELLKDLSAETQFILITHNRNTVSAADVIYGVTMNKESSSQVISMQLDEVNDDYVK